MNLYALIAGIILALGILITFRKRPLHHKARYYALLLASFPLFYWGFALYARDSRVLMYEIGFGLVFFVVAYWVATQKDRRGLFFLIAGYFGHTLYDVAHPFLFQNPGMPAWWPEFCAIIDALIGLYWLYHVWRPASVPALNTAGSEPGVIPENGP